MESGYALLALGVICLCLNVGTAIKRGSGVGEVWYNRANNQLTSIGAFLASVLAIIVGIVKIMF